MCASIRLVSVALQLLTRDPVSGKPLDTGALIKLNFAKVSGDENGGLRVLGSCQNSEGNYHDPITFKVFSPYVHLVFIKHTVSATLARLILGECV